MDGARPEDLSKAACTLDGVLYERALHAASEGIIIASAQAPDLPIVFVNAGFTQITGYGPSDVIGRNCRFLQGDLPRQPAVDQMAAAIRAGQAISVELLNVRKHGEEFWNNLSISPVRNAEGELTHYIGIISDITDRRLLQDQFHQAQKMEAVGRLAMGIAHDFNNVLSAIHGYTELVLNRCTKDDPNRADLREVLDAAKRATLLTTQLLTFSRKQAVLPVILTGDEMLQEMSRMFSRLLGEDLDVAYHLGAPGVSVLIDPGQFTQAILNLVVNARDAIPGVGRIDIATRELPRELLPPNLRTQATAMRYYLIEVHDNGYGMAPEVLQHAIEPFYTTKGDSGGTGLGLATVYGVVTQCGGNFEIQSAPGVGTTVRLYLPVVTEPGDERASQSTTSSSELQNASVIDTGWETLLVVDDEARVLELMRRVLHLKGYNVIAAPGPAEALEMMGEFGSQVHMVISDIVMPKMSGLEMVQRMMNEHGLERALFVTGYTEDRAVNMGELPANTALLRKPFTPSDLALKVREVLDTPLV